MASRSTFFFRLFLNFLTKVSKFAIQQHRGKQGFASESRLIKHIKRSIVIVLLFDCSSILNRITDEYQTWMNRVKEGAATRLYRGCQLTKTKLTWEKDKSKVYR